MFRLMVVGLWLAALVVDASSLRKTSEMKAEMEVDQALSNLALLSVKYDCTAAGTDLTQQLTEIQTKANSKMDSVTKKCAASVAELDRLKKEAHARIKKQLNEGLSALTAAGGTHSKAVADATTALQESVDLADEQISKQKDVVDSSETNVLSYRPTYDAGKAAHAHSKTVVAEFLRVAKENLETSTSNAKTTRGSKISGAQLAWTTASNRAAQAKTAAIGRCDTSSTTATAALSKDNDMVKKLKLLVGDLKVCSDGKGTAGGGAPTKVPLVVEPTKAVLSLLELDVTKLDANCKQHGAEVKTAVTAVSKSDTLDVTGNIGDLERRVEQNTLAIAQRHGACKAAAEKARTDAKNVMDSTKTQQVADAEKQFSSDITATNAKHVGDLKDAERQENEATKAVAVIDHDWGALAALVTQSIQAMKIVQKEAKEVKDTATKDREVARVNNRNLLGHAAALLKEGSDKLHQDQEDAHKSGKDSIDHSCNVEYATIQDEIELSHKILTALKSIKVVDTARQAKEKIAAATAEKAQKRMIEEEGEKQVQAKAKFEEEKVKKAKQVVVEEASKKRVAALVEKNALAKKEHAEKKAQEEKVKAEKRAEKVKEEAVKAEIKAKTDAADAEKAAKEASEAKAEAKRAEEGDKAAAKVRRTEELEKQAKAAAAKEVKDQETKVALSKAEAVEAMKTGEVSKDEKAEAAATSRFKAAEGLEEIAALRGDETKAAHEEMNAELANADATDARTSLASAELAEKQAHHKEEELEQNLRD